MENTIKEKLIKEARRIEEDSLYSAKGHFAAANFWTNFHFWVGVPTAILAAIASASALSRFDNHNIIAGVLAIIVTALTAVTTFLNPNEKVNSHLNAGNKYNLLRNKARKFCEIDCCVVDSIQELSKRLNELAEQRDELNIKSPQIPRCAYKKAKKGIEEGEADYKVDKNENI
ncbi:SLATT domain-containing protein [Thermanaerothrix sp.]|uniref:SLATT domain-containing protein n=1 Tax=Thermanaerothrix sp. TaxID=2972675 RepID=UPI003C7A9FC8